MAKRNQDARVASTGRYIRTPENAHRDAEACNLRTQGLTYQQIADRLGWTDKSAAYAAVNRALADITREPAEALLHFEVERLDAELQRLNEYEAEARTVLKNPHIMVNNGRVILHPGTDEPMEDDAPVLQALDRLVKIEDARRRNAERRAKLLGLDAEQKVNVSGSVKYEVIGVNPEDLT